MDMNNYYYLTNNWLTVNWCTVTIVLMRWSRVCFRYPQPVVTNQLGTVNNIIQVKTTDFEVFDALMVDSQKCSDMSGQRTLSCPSTWPLTCHIYTDHVVKAFRGLPASLCFRRNVWFLSHTVVCIRKLHRGRRKLPWSCQIKKLNINFRQTHVDSLFIH